MFVLKLIHRDCQVHGVTMGGAGPGWELSTQAQSQAEKVSLFFLSNKNKSFRNFVCTTLLLPHIQFHQGMKFSSWFEGLLGEPLHFLIVQETKSSS